MQFIESDNLLFISSEEKVIKIIKLQNVWIVKKIVNEQINEEYLNKNQNEEIKITKEIENNSEEDDLANWHKF